MIRRREFITLVGGSAAWPLAARAQQSDRMRRIGVVMNMAADDPESRGRLSALVQGLQELGWIVGRNLRIDYRWAEGDAERYRKQAAEIFALEPDVIVSWSAEIANLQKASRPVPIVFRWGEVGLRASARNPGALHFPPAAWRNSAAGRVTVSPLF